MYLIQGTMSMVTNQYYLTSIRLYHAQLRTSALGALFSDITDLLMIMTLAEMGNGFLFCLTQTRTGLQRAVRIASIASCVILSLLAIARFGVSNAVYSQYISDSWYSYTNDSLDESREKMAGAFSILTFVWALLLLVFAAVVFNKTKRNYILKNVSCAPGPLRAALPASPAEGKQTQHVSHLLTQMTTPVRRALPRRRCPELHQPPVHTHLRLHICPVRLLPLSL